MDTSQKKILRTLFFPDGLRGRKLKVEPGLRESKKPLVKYLETEDSEYLFQAIRANHHDILKDYGIPEASLRYDKIKYVDAHTIVWVSINHWQWMHISNRGRDEIVNEAVRRLIRVGRALIPYEIKDYEEVSCGEYFIHILPKWKKSDAYIMHKNAKEFVSHFDNVYRLFENGLKKRYRTVDKSLIDEMHDELERNKAFIWKLSTEKNPKIDRVLHIIKENLDKKITIMDLKRFNIKTKKNITASYIAWINEKSCPICHDEARKRKTKKVGYGPILNLYKQASEKLGN